MKGVKDSFFSRTWFKKTDPGSVYIQLLCSLDIYKKHYENFVESLVARGTLERPENDSKTLWHREKYLPADLSLDKRPHVIWHFDNWG